jgi:hypothetical protein
MPADADDGAIAHDEVEGLDRVWKPAGHGSIIASVRRTVKHPDEGRARAPEEARR